MNIALLKQVIISVPRVCIISLINLCVYVFFKRRKFQIKKEFGEASLITKASFFLFFLGFEGFLFTEFVCDIVQINFNYIIFIYLSLALSIVDKFLFYLRKNLLFSVIYFLLMITMFFAMINNFLIILPKSHSLLNLIVISTISIIHYYLRFVHLDYCKSK